MPNKNLTEKQIIFQELLIGSLIYTVVFGFFNDYTNILTTTSYSATFFAAVVMMGMTFPIFKLKSWLIQKFKQNRLVMFLSVWLVMFLSKFLILEGIALVFGDYVQISGFFGLIIIIVTATFFQKLTGYVYNRLGNNDQKLEIG